MLHKVAVDWCNARQNEQQERELQGENTAVLDCVRQLDVNCQLSRGPNTHSIF